MRLTGERSPSELERGRVQNRLNTINHALSNAYYYLLPEISTEVTQPAATQANVETPQYPQNTYENPAATTYAQTTIATDVNHGNGVHLDDIRDKISGLHSGPKEGN